MTDPRPEQVEALAEALRKWDAGPYSAQIWMADARAILAAIPSMRLVPTEVADIGEAVQRLDGYTYVRLERDRPREWQVEYEYPDGDSGYIVSRGTAATIPEAIAAALDGPIR